MTQSSIASQHGFTLERHESVGSTNDLAMDHLRQGGADRHCIIAAKQEQGRGRLGRVWVSKPGNLYASLALRDPCEISKGFQLGFVAALAIRNTLVGAGARPEMLSLKWPNDVLMRGAKISGILIEGTKLPNGCFAAVIGTGINLVDHPEDTPYPATDLACEGVAVSVDLVLPLYLQAWNEALTLFDHGRRFNRVRSDWLSHARGIGASVEVRSKNAARKGIFAGLDDEGRLLLDENGYVTPVVAGDVFF